MPPVLVSNYADTREMTMPVASGRPRRACGTCNGQKIRCSGEKPICRRCDRLNHTCVYEYEKAPARAERKSRRGSNAAATTSLTLPSHLSAQADKRNGSTIHSGHVSHALGSTSVLQQPTSEGNELGIPGSLLLKLIDVYFENVYNAGLLLHKASFLESLSCGTARPHVVLSVCALAANYYRDKNGQSVFKDHGFMIEWAQRAGKYVFSDIESFHDDNFVTFVNMCLFWHSQGSWRTFYLHKGNALNLLVILGLGSGTHQIGDPWKAEIRRRRLWACYLMHCQNSESLSRFPVDGMEDLPLPWTQAEFNAKASQGPSVTLRSGKCSGGIWSRIIRGMTLWSSVVNFIKNPNPDLNTKLARIHALDDEIAEWWQGIPDDVRLTPSTIATVPQDELPNILLVNIVYHQSLCALHSSIVPLFSWGEGDARFATARRCSAQEAYEHACTASELFGAVLSTYDRVSAMPSFIAYAAYCGCAIQVPFLRCSNITVREKAQTNVRVNMRMMQIMASYWKFAYLLRVYCRCLLDRHKTSPTILEDEPRHVDIEKLTSFKGNSPYAKASILESIGIFHSKEDGYSVPGREVIALGNDQNGGGKDHPSRSSLQDETEDSATAQSRTQLVFDNEWGEEYSTTAVAAVAASSDDGITQTQQQRQTLDTSSAPLGSQDVYSHLFEDQTFDIFHPLRDPQVIDLFPDGNMPDISILDTSPFNLDYYNLDNFEGAGSFNPL